MGQRFLVEILDVAQDTIAVSAPGSDYPIDGMGVTLEFHEFGSVVSYHTRVVVGPRQKGDPVILQRMAGLARKHHRRAWRVSLDAYAHLRRHGDIHYQAARIVNISTEGALIETSADLELNDLFDLRLALPGEPSHWVLGRVIRAEPSESDARQFGVLFVELSVAAKRSLTTHIWRCVRRERSDDVSELFPGSKKHRKLMARRRREREHPAESAD